MGKRGPAKTPTRLKILKGTLPKAQALKEIEPDPLLDIPPAPGHLNEFAKLEWNKQIKYLVESKVVAPCDLTNFQILCYEYGEYRALSEEVREEGRVLLTDKGNVYANPKEYMCQAHLKIYLQISAKFGLTPSDRVGIPKPLGDPKIDPLTEMMKKLHAVR